MAESIDQVYRIVGQEQVLQALGRMEDGARRFGESARSAISPARQATMAFSSALSSVATVMRLTGDESSEMAQKMERLSIALSVTIVAVQSLRGVLISMPAILAAIRLGVIALTGPIGVAIAGALALATGVQYLFNVLQANREATDAAAAAARGHADALKLEELSIFAVAGAADTLRQKIKDLGVTQEQWDKIRRFAAKDSPEAIEATVRLAQETERLASAAADKRFRQAVEDVQAWQAAQEAVAQTIQSTSARLVTLLDIKDQTITRLQRLARAGGLTSEQLRTLDSTIASLRNQMVGLRGDIDAAATSWQKLATGLGGVQRLVESGVEAGIALATTLRAESEAAEQTRQIQEGIATTRRQLIVDTQAYKDAVTEATRAQEDWNRQNEFDVRQQSEIEAGFQRRVTQLERSLELTDDVVARRRLEITGIQQLTAALNQEITALREEIAAKIAAGLPTDDLAKSLQRLIDTLGSLEHRGALAAKSLETALADPARRMLQELTDGFERSFADILSSAQSFGDALTSFMRGIVNSIIGLFANRLAKNLFNFLLPLLGGPSGGPLGFPTATLAAGGIIDRPTLAMVGEGGEREAVIPEHLWPAFNAGRGGSGGREVVVNVNVVTDVRQIPRTSPQEIQATVVVDLMTNGPISRQIRATIPR